MVLKAYKQQKNKSKEDKIIEKDYEAHKKIFAFDYMTNKELNNKYKREYL